jgi:RNA polymerase sigma-32 factor
LVAEEPVALADLGERFGISRERIRQIESRIKDRLRDFLTDKDRLGPGFQLDFTSRD